MQSRFALYMFKTRNVYKPSAIFIVTYGSNVLVFLFLVMRKTPRKQRATLYSADKHMTQTENFFYINNIIKSISVFRNTVVGNSPQQKHADVKSVFVLELQVKHGT